MAKPGMNKTSARAENPIGTRQRSSSRVDVPMGGGHRMLGGVGVSRTDERSSPDRVADTSSFRELAEGRSSGDTRKRPSSSGNDKGGASTGGGSQKSRPTMDFKRAQMSHGTTFSPPSNHGHAAASTSSGAAGGSPRGGGEGSSYRGGGRSSFGGSTSSSSGGGEAVDDERGPAWLESTLKRVYEQGRNDGAKSPEAPSTGTQETGRGLSQYTLPKAKKSKPVEEPGRGTEHSTRAHCFVPFSTGIIGSGGNSPHVMAAAVKILRVVEDCSERADSMAVKVRNTLSSARSKLLSDVTCGLLSVLPVLLDRGCTRLVAEANASRSQDEDQPPFGLDDLDHLWSCAALNNMIYGESFDDQEVFFPFIEEVLKTNWGMGHYRAVGVGRDVTIPDCFGSETSWLDFMEEVGVATIVGAISIIRIAKDPLKTDTTTARQSITRRIRVALVGDRYGASTLPANSEDLRKARLSFNTMFWQVLYDFATKEGRPGAHIFSKPPSQLDEEDSIMAVMPYIIGGLISEKGGESSEGEGDQDGKEGDDGSKNKDNGNGEKETGGSRSEKGDGEGAGHTDKDDGVQVSPAACEGAGIPETGSAGPDPPVEKSTNATG